MPDYSIEKNKIEQGYLNVCGIDEAGRGPLCGPVVAAACIMPIDVDIPRLNDSKKLSPKVRLALFVYEKFLAVLGELGEEVEHFGDLRELSNALL